MDEKKLILPAPIFPRQQVKLMAFVHFQESEIDTSLLLDIPSPAPEDVIVVLASPVEKRVAIIGNHSLLMAMAHHLVHIPEHSVSQIFLVGDNNPRKTAEEILLSREKMEPILAPFVNFSLHLREPESFFESKQRKLRMRLSKKISPRRIRNP